MPQSAPAHTSDWWHYSNFSLPRDATLVGGYRVGTDNDRVIVLASGTRKYDGVLYQIFFPAANHDQATLLPQVGWIPASAHAGMKIETQTGVHDEVTGERPSKVTLTFGSSTRSGWAWKGHTAPYFGNVVATTADGRKTHLPTLSRETAASLFDSIRHGRVSVFASYAKAVVTPAAEPAECDFYGNRPPFAYRAPNGDEYVLVTAISGTMGQYDMMWVKPKGSERFVQTPTTGQFVGLDGFDGIYRLGTNQNPPLYLHLPISKGEPARLSPDSARYAGGYSASTVELEPISIKPDDLPRLKAQGLPSDLSTRYGFVTPRF